MIEAFDKVITVLYKIIKVILCVVPVSYTHLVTTSTSTMGLHLQSTIYRAWIDLIFEFIALTLNFRNI